MTAFFYFWVSYSSWPDSQHPVTLKLPILHQSYTFTSTWFFETSLVACVIFNFKTTVSYSLKCLTKVHQIFLRSKSCLNIAEETLVYLWLLAKWGLSLWTSFYCRLAKSNQSRTTHWITWYERQSCLQIVTAPPIWFSLSMIVEVRACVSVSYPQCRIFSLCPT